MTEQLHSVTGPSLTDIGQDHQLWLVKPDSSAPKVDDDGIDITLRARCKFANDTVLLSHAQSTWEQHAMESFIDKATEDGSTGTMSQASKKGKLPTFAEHIASIASDRKPSSKVGLGEASMGSSLKGRAAEMLELQDSVDSDGADENLHADLTDQIVRKTPSKRGKTEGSGRSDAGTLTCDGSGGGGDDDGDGSENESEDDFDEDNDAGVFWRGQGSG